MLSLNGGSTRDRLSSFRMSEPRRRDAPEACGLSGIAETDTDVRAAGLAAC
ncbi:hypothetical protein GCM10009846_01340 [Agrococcus versicolor]|uniref:Uncharacterized protein n=1 Tax=Agrococcus versicolor TaxID=501482 RepID=A0ABP5MDS7_9MICO